MQVVVSSVGTSTLCRQAGSPATTIEPVFAGKSPGPEQVITVYMKMTHSCRFNGMRRVFHSIAVKEALCWLRQFLENPLDPARLHILDPHTGIEANLLDKGISQY